MKYKKRRTKKKSYRKSYRKSNKRRKRRTNRRRTNRRMKGGSYNRGPGDRCEFDSDCPRGFKCLEKGPDDMREVCVHPATRRTRAKMAPEREF